MCATVAANKYSPTTNRVGAASMNAIATIVRPRYKYFSKLGKGILSEGKKWPIVCARIVISKALSRNKRLLRYRLAKRSIRIPNAVMGVVVVLSY